MTAAPAPRAIALVPPRTRRDFARRIFWTTHPICQLCAIAYGDWQGGTFAREGAFSLAQLIRYVESLPPDVYGRLAAQDGSI